MQVNIASNFKGATIRPVVPRQKHYWFYCSPLDFLGRKLSLRLAYFEFTAHQFELQGERMK